MLPACRAVCSYFNLWTVPERDNCQEVMQDSKYTLQGTNTHRRDLRSHETREQLRCGRVLLPVPRERLSKNSQDRGNVLVLRTLVLSPCHFDCPPSKRSRVMERDDCRDVKTADIPEHTQTTL